MNTPARSPSLTIPSAVLTALLLGFVIAPTPGDIGGCGQSAQQLDAQAFFQNKKHIDCDRCETCDLMNWNTCSSACDPKAVVAEAFAPGCFPLVHDGEVCLRALLNASCSDYESYMHPVPANRSTPSECNFCPLR